MYYKVEILRNNRVVQHNTYKDLNHPKQVVRRVLQNKNLQKQNSIIFITNDKGEMWVYSARVVKDRLEVRLMRKLGGFLTKDEVDLIFTNNARIVDFCKGRTLP